MLCSVKGVKGQNHAKKIENDWLTKCGALLLIDSCHLVFLLDQLDLLGLMSLTVATMPLAKVIELDTLLFNVLKLFFFLFDQEISVILKAPIDVLQSLD